MIIEKTKEFTVIKITPNKLLEYLGIDTSKHLFCSLSINPESEDITIVTSNEVMNK